jgi:hypothetical protein
MQTQTITTNVTKVLSFYKENNIWYADLPAFLDAGLGTKANLMMVDGADTFLDYVSNNTKSTTIKLSTVPFIEADAVLNKLGYGMNSNLLEEVGHAYVDHGAYYLVEKFKDQSINHQLWLCPVTEYVFEGGYPQTIYIQLLKINK